MLGKNEGDEDLIVWFERTPNSPLNLNPRNRALRPYVARNKNEHQGDEDCIPAVLRGRQEFHDTQPRLAQERQSNYLRPIRL